MRRSKKYPRSTGAWMATRGWADLTGCPKYVRDAAVTAGVAEYSRARLFAPTWVLWVYRATEDAFAEPWPESNRPLACSQFGAVLRAVQKDPSAFDSEAARAAYRLGGKKAMLDMLGVT